MCQSYILKYAGCGHETAKQWVGCGTPSESLYYNCPKYKEGSMPATLPWKDCGICKSMGYYWKDVELVRDVPAKSLKGLW